MVMTSMGATAIQIGTTTATEMRGKVFIKTPDMQPAANELTWSLRA